MEHTANLDLPYILPSQAQKHVTHNEAIRTLDAIVQLAVMDRDLFEPPASPAEGERYLVAAEGADAWSGRDGRIAAWQDGAWTFLEPKAGWLAWVTDEERLLCHDGAAWADAAVHSVNPASFIGVNATADLTNRLSVKGAATLFDAETDDHRVKINKTAAPNTASIILQSGYSGRAELGLAGDDDWRLKVSADGATWTEALRVDPSTGRVRLPAGLPLEDQDQVAVRRHLRERLVANRTYYVRTDGNDANLGLTNVSGGAFLTVQRAMDVAATLDFNGFAVTVQLADGTYPGFALQVNVGQSNSSKLIVNGNGGAPGNVVVSGTVNCPLGTAGIIQNLAIAPGAAAIGLNVSGGCVDFGNVAFGACLHHIFVQNGGVATAAGNYSITGPASRHWWVRNGGVMIADFRTVTLSGSPAFTSFALCQQGTILCGVMVFFGVATGSRYAAQLNGVINTAGGGANYLPGSTAGSSATGGQYA